MIEILFILTYGLLFFQAGPSNRERVSAFIDGTIQYMSGQLKSATPGHDKSEPGVSSLTDQQTNAVIQTIASISQQAAMTPSPNMAASRLPEIAPPTGSITQGAQLSDTASDASSDVAPTNTATFPQYDFKMSASKLALFLSVFNITKHKLEGSGFPV